MSRPSFYNHHVGDSGALGEQEVAVCRMCHGADCHTDECLVPAFEAELDDRDGQIDDLRAKLSELLSSDTIKGLLAHDREYDEHMAAMADANSY